MEPEYAEQVIAELPGKSALLGMMKQEPMLSSDTRYYPVMTSKPKAYFVSPTDVGYRQSTEVTWEYADLAIEEISTFVVVPQNVLRDSNYPIWDRIRPELEAAIAEVIDKTILYGGNGMQAKPATWPDGLVTQAASLGRTVSLAESTDLYSAVLSEEGTWTLVEQDGFDVTGNIAARKMKGRIRNLRGEDGRPIFQDGKFYDTEITYPDLNTFKESNGLLLSGDFSRAIYAIREDITYRMTTDATISDPDTGLVIYNLVMEKLAAIFVDIRLGWQLPRPVNWHKQSAADRPFSFALLTA
jgi:HK97 family phage major capsid protein